MNEIPTKLFELYDYLRVKLNRIAVVAVDGRSCGGCHMQLRIENLNRLYRLYSANNDLGDIVQCDNCLRILFLPDKSAFYY
jgi:predicted  nucleic acid-binding Zn-ribbon protein